MADVDKVSSSRRQYDSCGAYLLKGYGGTAGAALVGNPDVDKVSGARRHYMTVVVDNSQW
jgi:hypothetical protein